MAEAPEKTAEELAAEERELAIKRGDIIVDEDEGGKPDGDESGDVPEGEGDGGEETASGDDPGSDEQGSGEEADGSDAGEASDAGGDEGDAGDGGEGDEGDEKPIMIPKARFDEAQRKARDKVDALQRKLDKAEQAHAKETTDADLDAVQTEIDGLEDKYEEHLLEGELEKARAVRRELKTKREEHRNKMLTQQSQQTGNAAVEQIRYETKLAVFEEKYPAINPDSSDFDEAIHNEVAELKSAFEAQGWGSTAALEKAVHYAVPREAPAAKGDEPDPEIKKSQRAHKARKAAAAANKATPPDTSKAGRDSDKGGKGDGLPDVTKMSPEQFDKWAESDPAAMAKLRGDTLTAEDAA